MKESFFYRHRLPTIILGVLLAALIAVLLWIGDKKRGADEFQARLAPFYSLPEPLPPGPPGEVIRKEPLGVTVEGGQGWRILYRSENADGTPTVSSGMLFIPDLPAAGPRPVVAWAHPTTGMGDDCAPSRSQKPLADMGSWISLMLNRGWVVSATDYAGLGTPGVESYLVGRDEARDVLNSVRAARLVPEAQASTDFALWGHSQGGHAVLFATQLSESYAPELVLVATAAAAPAAEIAPLFSQQYRSLAVWIIGPEVVVAWPKVYPDLAPDQVTTPAGQRSYPQVAEKCLAGAAETGLIRHELGEEFFRIDPMALESWYQAATAETPPAPPSDKPLMIAQGLADEVVLPDTTALYIQKACSAGASLTTLWLGDTGHNKAAMVAGPMVADWLADRFAGRPAGSSCSQPLPVQPAAPVPPPASG